MREHREQPQSPQCAAVFAEDAAIGEFEYAARQESSSVRMRGGARNLPLRTLESICQVHELNTSSSVGTSLVQYKKRIDHNFIERS